ncbi:hypothetical protein C480_10709 [Natrialba aegyptia DSM 13077]|uniref:Uncharacterized protein n=1 Tax=Natrialba aegyptia DSM 13077 TaxID=1227491 RepID=M0B3G8_9EURY|nr:hypothetical protein C480_10709 [Natrialba aegyptia DSM 13077]
MLVALGHRREGFIEPVGVRADHADSTLDEVFDPRGVHAGELGEVLGAAPAFICAGLEQDEFARREVVIQFSECGVDLVDGDSAARRFPPEVEDDCGAATPFQRDFIDRLRRFAVGFGTVVGGCVEVRSGVGITARSTQASPWPSGKSLASMS